MNSLEKMTLFLSKNNQQRYLFYTKEYPYHPRHNSHFVGNKTKGRISKRVFQESKARQIFRKTNISYSLIRTRSHVRVQIRGGKKCSFFGKLGMFCFLVTPISRLALLTYYRRNTVIEYGN